MECLDHGLKGNKDGYAMRNVRSIGRCVALHRVVYCEHNGVPIESINGLVIRHTCDNPRCINPDHLVTGSQADNIQDKLDRNRQAKGSRMAAAKLSEDDVPVIRALLAAGATCAAIARRFGVSRPLIGYIKNGKSWRHA